jgi:phosphatidylglycerol:prolipoprotein diacylglycerol transferase
MTAKQYKSFLDVIALWEGGLAIYGALIAGAITVYTVCRVKKISFMKAFDMASPALLLAQAIGRWGNFFNGEAYGRVIPEDSPLYFIRMGIFPNEIEGAYGMAYVHPTFLYESLWNMIGFIIINALYKKKKFDGQVFFMYITWYGFGRMLIEGLRIDSLYLGVFRISQVVAFACFVVGSIVLIYKLLGARRARLTEASYEPAYPKFSHMPLRTFSNASENESDNDNENDDENDDENNKDEKGEE